MILFLNMMTRSAGLELTQEHIERAAKVTFLNVILLSLLCTSRQETTYPLYADRLVVLLHILLTVYKSFSNSGGVKVIKKKRTLQLAFH